MAAYELQCADAAIATVREAILLRDLDMARDPCRQVADCPELPLDETDPDWLRLAYRALRVILDANEENFRRDHGTCSAPKAVFSRALTSHTDPRPISQVYSLPAHTRCGGHRTTKHPIHPNRNVLLAHHKPLIDRREQSERFVANIRAARPEDPSLT